MMAAAYAFAEGSGPMPHELYILNCIDRFGVQATLGRKILGAKEIRLMAICENIVEGYRDRDRAQNFAEWTNQNPDKSAMLDAAYKLAHDMGLIDV